MAGVILQSKLYEPPVNTDPDNPVSMEDCLGPDVYLVLVPPFAVERVPAAHGQPEHCMVYVANTAFALACTPEVVLNALGVGRSRSGVVGVQGAPPLPAFPPRGRR